MTTLLSHMLFESAGTEPEGQVESTLTLCSSDCWGCLDSRDVLRAPASIRLTRRLHDYVRQPQPYRIEYNAVAILHSPPTFDQISFGLPVVPKQ